MHSLGIVQWNFTRRDHPGNPERVSGSGPVTMILVIMKHFVIFQILRMYIMLCQSFYFMSFSFFYKSVSIRSVCILQVIIGGVLFRQGIILI